MTQSDILCEPRPQVMHLIDSINDKLTFNEDGSRDNSEVPRQLSHSRSIVTRVPVTFGKPFIVNSRRSLTPSLKSHSHATLIDESLLFSNLVVESGALSMME